MGHSDQRLAVPHAGPHDPGGREFLECGAQGPARREIHLGPAADQVTAPLIKSTVKLFRQRMLQVGFLAAMTGAVHAEISIAPAELKAIGKIDVRFQSYNIEMVEVTGGRFWKPYAQGGGR